MAPALWWIMQTMLPQRERRKLILILTNGEPDAIAPTVKALETASKAGFEVYAIGIKSTVIAHLLPQSSQGITTLAELPRPCSPCCKRRRCTEATVMLPVDFLRPDSARLSRQGLVRQHRRIPRC